MQLIEGRFQGLEIVIGALVGQEATIALYGGKQDLVGVQEAGVGIVVRKPLVEPPGELRRKGHEDAIVELTVCQLVDALGNQGGQAGNPGYRRVFQVLLACNTGNVGKDRSGVDRIVRIVEKQRNVCPGEDVYGALDLVETSSFAARLKLLAHHLNGEADPALGIVCIVKAALLISKDFADNLVHKLFVGAGIEIDIATFGLDRGGLNGDAARALDALAASARGIDKTVLMDRKALIRTAKSVLRTGRNGVFWDRVPKLDGIGKLCRLAEERRKEVVL